MNKPTIPNPSINHSGYRVGNISINKQLTKTNAIKTYSITFNIFSFVHHLIASHPYVT